MKIRSMILLVLVVTQAGVFISWRNPWSLVVDVKARGQTKTDFLSYIHFML